jgi:hypothetical protein
MGCSVSKVTPAQTDKVVAEKVVAGEPAVKVHRPSITSIPGTYTSLAKVQKEALADELCKEPQPKLPAAAEEPSASAAVRRLTKGHKDFFIKYGFLVLKQVVGLLIFAPNKPLATTEPTLRLSNLASWQPTMLLLYKLCIVLGAVLPIHTLHVDACHVDDVTTTLFVVVCNAGPSSHSAGGKEKS